MSSFVPAAVQMTAGLAVACTVVAAASTPKSLQSAQDLRDQAVGTGLEEYIGGSFDRGVARILGANSIRETRRSFERDAAKWVESGGSAQRFRRTAAVAAMSVELMAVSFQQHYLDYEEAREMVERACSRLRKFDPSEVERWFHLAAMSLMQGAIDDSLLAGVPPEIFRAPLSVPGNDAHPRHAGLRFPAEARFKLGYITARMEAEALATWQLPPNYLVTEGPGFRFWIDRGRDAQLILETLRGLSLLFGEPSVSHEARLRSGVIRFLIGDRERANADLIEAAASRDMHIRYVAHLMLGHVDERGQRHAAALEHYRAAYAAVPATASRIALSTLLFRMGRDAEAAETLSALNDGPPPADPWREYSRRDYRFFTQYRAQMRATLVGVK